MNFGTVIQAVDEVGTNFTQQLYEQMKRNYNIE